MKFSNFKITKTIEKYGMTWESYGTVDITTGFWKWKKTITHKIFKVGANWQFSATAQWTPGGIVERLEQVYKLKLEGHDD